LFVTEKPLSVVALIMSKKQLMQLRYESDPAHSGPPNGLHNSAELLQSWYRYLVECYATAQQMLDGLQPESLIGRAVGLTGEAIWTVDPEERFFYAWRALEVIANADLSRARSEYDAGTKSASSPYIDPHLRTYLDKVQVRLEANILVGATIASRLGESQLAKVPQFYELRNAIAHGMITRRQHAAVIEQASSIVECALRVVKAELRKTMSLPVLPKGDSQTGGSPPPP
jgi:hypothetical protein